MSLAIWVRSLQSRIEKIVGEKPDLMVTFIAARDVDEWGVSVQFPKDSKWRYIRKEFFRRDLVELMDEGNKFADTFREFEEKETTLYNEIPF